MNNEWILISNSKIPADVPAMQMIETALSDYRRLKVLARFAKNINGTILAYRHVTNKNH
jgi:hypothetical protein